MLALYYATRTKYATGEDATIKSLSSNHSDRLEWAELLAGLRAHDPVAFEKFLIRFEGPVYRFFYYSHGQHERAQDECGETFAQLVTAIRKYNGNPEGLRAFLFGIARNVQRRGWRNDRDDYIAECESVDLPFEGKSVVETVINEQEFARALYLMQHFEDPTRQALLMRYVEEMKITEVAEALALPVNTVKSLLRRGCCRLQQLMEAETIETPGEKR